jgi:hypothetical protein
MIRQLGVQASDRGCGQPHGRVQAVRRLPHAADRRMIGVREPANGESRVDPNAFEDDHRAGKQCHPGYLGLGQTVVCL